MKIWDSWVSSARDKCSCIFLLFCCITKLWDFLGSSINMLHCGKVTNKFQSDTVSKAIYWSLQWFLNEASIQPFSRVTDSDQTLRLPSSDFNINGANPLPGELELIKRLAEENHPFIHEGFRNIKKLLKTLREEEELWDLIKTWRTNISLKLPS